MAVGWRELGVKGWGLGFRVERSRGEDVDVWLSS